LVLVAALARARRRQADLPLDRLLVLPLVPRDGGGVFEKDDVAAFLNAHFVSIKVDREERPDLDEVYMRALLSMNGSGGWPMSLFSPRR
jgi:hypothetical protein